MRAYKGFNNDLTCREFQYEIGKKYEENTAELCHRGFHACEAPLDTFKYYSPSNSRFCEVELEEVTDETCDDTKRVGKKITIGHELGISELVEAQIGYVKAHIEEGAIEEHATGICGVASTTRKYGAASTTGYGGAASTTGNSGAASATGYGGAASATGYGGAASATGECGAAYAGHKTAVAVAWGLDSKAKGVLGAHLMCAEWEFEDNEWVINSVKTTIVDGEKIKPDIWYTVKNGEWQEVH